MITDETLKFCEDQAITADAGSTNYIDLGQPGTPYGGSALKRDVGTGTRVPLWILVSETFNNLTTLTVSLQVDDNTSFSSAKTVSSVTIALADLVAGYRLPFPDYLPEGTDERYLRIYFDVTGTAPTTGKVSAYVVSARQTNLGGHYGA